MTFFYFLKDEKLHFCIFFKGQLLVLIVNGLSNFVINSILFSLRLTHYYMIK